MCVCFLAPRIGAPPAARRPPPTPPHPCASLARRRLARQAKNIREGGLFGFAAPRINTPPDKEFSLGDMGTCVAKNRGGLRLVDISRTHFFFLVKC